MNTHDIDIELPPLPRPDAEFGTHSRKQIREYTRAAIKADRKRIANAISDRCDNVEEGNVNRDCYYLGMATAYDIAEQIVLGELEK